MKSKKVLIALIIWLSVINPFIFNVSVEAQDSQPIQITFGQPNIWSLEQAHYLLSQMRERSLGIKSRNLDRLDPNSAEGARLNLVRQLFQLSGEFRQMPQLENPATSPSPTPTPLQSPVPFPSPFGNAPNQLENSVINELLKDKEFRSKLYGDSKLNATTQLDNHIQLQYEIIAKQLTLLRDEVGPEERLVFLELPQSIYASAKNTDGKVAQTYWELAGYSVKQKEAVEIEKIRKKCNQIDEDKWGKNDTRNNKEIIQSLLESARKNNKTLNVENYGDFLCTKDVLIKPAVENGAIPQITASTNYTNVRAVDIIPRQSSLNVTDVQETVKTTILSGAFSWLFGLGLRTNFQRQRDTFEQYLHQEIYASGFGKGENQFGWTFGAVPGTKRIAPGIRTTYAVVVIPKDAEAVILNARGCYFPRKSYQPENAMEDSDLINWSERNKRQCGAKQQFLIPIPNGGDRRGLWATKIDYTPVKKGKRIVASINGFDFSSQVGVLINGVPLQQVVELTKKLGDNELLKAGCDEGICGSYEVIDSNEITFVVKMPDDYEDTPEITLIGPGRSVSLNSIELERITIAGEPVKIGGAIPASIKLPNKAVPFMFGNRSGDPNAKLTLSKIKFFPEFNSRPTSALLTGTKFSEHDEIYINNILINNDFLKSSEHRLTIPAAVSSYFTDSITVTVKHCLDTNTPPNIIRCGTVANEKIESESTAFPLPSTQFSVTRVLALSYDKDKTEMFISVEGTGLDGVTLTKVNGKNPAANSVVIPVSSRELLVKVMQPESVVKITLTNSQGNEINAVLVRPPDVTVEK